MSRVQGAWAAKGHKPKITTDSIHKQPFEIVYQENTEVGSLRSLKLYVPIYCKVVPIYCWLFYFCVNYLYRHHLENLTTLLSKLKVNEFLVMNPVACLSRYN